MITHLEIISSRRKSDKHVLDYGLSVHFSDQDPTILYPIEGDNVTGCVRLTDTKIAGCTESKKLFVYDVYERRVVSSTELEWPVHFGQIWRISDNKIITKNYHGIFELWHTNTLNKFYAFSGAMLDSNGSGHIFAFPAINDPNSTFSQIKAGKDLVVRNNHIIGNIDDFEMEGYEKGPRTTGTYSINLASGAFRKFTHIETNVSFDDFSAFGSVLGNFSPSGKYALKSDKTTLPYNEIDGKSFGVVADLMSIHVDEGPKLVKKLDLMSYSESDLNGDERPSRIQDLTDIACNYCKNGAEPFLELKKAAPLDKAMRKKAHSLSQLHSMIWQVLWEPDETAFWIRSGQNTIRRVSIDGELSPIVTFERWQNSSGKIELSWRPDGALGLGSHESGYTCLIKNGATWAYPSRPLSKKEDNYRR